MLRFLRNPWKSLRKSIPLEDTTHRTTDIGAERRRDFEDEHCSRKIPAGRDDGTDMTMAPDVSREEGSRIANQDGSIEDQQLPALNTSTPTPVRQGDNTTLQGKGQIPSGSAEAQSKQLDPNAHDLQSIERVKERSPIDRVLGRTAFVVDLAKGPAEAFGPLKAVLASISNVYTQYQNTIAVKDKIEILRSRISTLEKLFEQPASDEKEIRLREGLLIKLKDIEEQLRSLGGKSMPLRYLDNVQDTEDVGGLLEDLHDAVNDYMMVHQMAIYDQGCKLMDAAEQSVLNNFRSARGAEYRHGERKGCLKGTRRTVLNTIELWSRDPTKSPIYWLNGLAGTGKSTIAKTVAERLFADGKLGASFFCSRDFEDRRNLQLIFPTLAIQLARRYTEFRSLLCLLIRSDPDVAYESLYNQMKKLIVQPLHESGISIVIVIDALDECEDEESASAILSVLGRLVSEIPKVKFFLTGRPEPRISEGFRLPLLAKMTDVFLLHKVEPHRVDRDIRLFFKTSFSELAGRRDGLDDWPTGEQLDRLCRRAAGLFVYAAATVKFIDTNKRDPRKQLDLLLQSQKIGVHEGKSLDLLYTSILREAFGDDKPEDDVKIRSVIGVVVLAANPLSPSTIAALLGFDAKDVLLLLSSVNSLLILHDANHPVRPFHKSFPDFVTDPTRCTNPRFHIPPPDHHSKLLIGCLELLTRTLEKNMCKLPNAVANSDVSDLKERTERYICPALRYACMSWHTHLVDVDTIPAHASAITSTLHQFLETKFMFWLEVLSVLSAARNAVEALQVTTDWLKESPTADLVNDCFRFVTGYFEIIAASSPHIYHSALVVAPEDSMMRKLYGSHAHPFTRVVRGMPTSWDPSTAATTRPSELKEAVWSPCNRFIAITWDDAATVDVLDSETLQRLQTLEPPQAISGRARAFVFSPDSRILTCSTTCLRKRSGEKLFIVSWDLQTGGVASVIKWGKLRQTDTGTSTITYSADGKTVAVAVGSIIAIYDVTSGVLMHRHSINGTPPLSNRVWSHGESWRSVTTDAPAITIREVGFALGTTPTKVETFPAPYVFGDGHEVVGLLPAPCRLALFYPNPNRIQIWDARDSACLLSHSPTWFRPEVSFSSDGHFFACSSGSDIYLWKESHYDGYTLHGILASSAKRPSPLLSQNGESIVAFGDCKIQLWRTKRLVTHPSTVSTRAPERTEYFILGFSPDGRLAVVAMWESNTVTVLNLKSGALQLTIDAGMKVYGLGVIGNAVVVIGCRKVTAWNLLDRVPGAWVDPKDSSWTTEYDNSQCEHASISPDSRHIVLTTGSSLNVYSVSTGKHLGRRFPRTDTRLRFSPNGRNVWLAGDRGDVTVWRVGGEQKMLELLEPKVDMEDPPEGNPWGSSRGYRVTNDWWVLSPGGKRLLMLPPLWQSDAVQRVWNEQFLALLHRGLPEPVILELEVDHDL